MDDHNLPFKVGSDVEVRSNLKGFRGAWFKCKIKSIGSRHGATLYLLEYVDYPDEKIKWTKIYQKYGKAKEERLMVRPNFPRVYHSSNLPDVKAISESIVVVNDAWKVGDLVDWLKDDCYWYGSITEILEKERVRLELPPPPAGEGLSYVVLCKDLRPSLDWSPVDGWTLPSSKTRRSYNPCAWVVNPLNQGKEKKDDLVAAGPSPYRSTSVPPLVSAGSLPPSEKSEHKTEQPASRKRIRTSEKIPNKSSADRGLAPVDCSPKKIEADEKIRLNSTHSPTIDAAMLDLEELISRVKWIKGILNLGTPLSETAKPSWRFQEHRPSSNAKPH